MGGNRPDKKLLELDYVKIRLFRIKGLQPSKPSNIHFLSLNDDIKINVY